MNKYIKEAEELLQNTGVSEYLEKRALELFLSITPEMPQEEHDEIMQFVNYQHIITSARLKEIKIQDKCEM